MTRRCQGVERGAFCVCVREQGQQPSPLGSLKHTRPRRACGGDCDWRRREEEHNINCCCVGARRVVFAFVPARGPPYGDGIHAGGVEQSTQRETERGGGLAAVGGGRGGLGGATARRRQSRKNTIDPRRRPDMGRETPESGAGAYRRPRRCGRCLRPVLITSISAPASCAISAGARLALYETRLSRPCEAVSPPREKSMA